MILLLATQALAVTFGLDGHVGGIVLSPEHELYDPEAGFAHAKYGGAPQLGARSGIHTKYGGAEIEGEYGLNANGSVFGGRFSLVTPAPHLTLNHNNAEVRPFLLAGIGNVGILSKKTGNDSDLGLHWGGGFFVPVRKNFVARIDARQLVQSRFGFARSVATHFGLYAGLGWRLKLKRNPELKEKVLELMNAYEHPPAASELKSLGSEVDDVLIEIAEDPDLPPSRRGRAVTSLQEYPSPVAKQWLTDVVKSEDAPPLIRRKGLYSLGNAFGEKALEEVAEHLDSDDPQMRVAATRTLVEMEHPEAEELLEEVPGVDFGVLLPDGTAVTEGVKLVVTHPNGNVTTHEEGTASFVDPIKAAEETWKASAEFGDCLAGSIEQTIGADRHGIQVQLETVLGAELEVTITDEQNQALKKGKITFKGDPYCVPETNEAGEIVVDDTGISKFPIGIGKFELFVSADGYALQKFEVETTEEGPNSVLAALPPSQITIAAGRIGTSEIQFQSGTSTLQASAYEILDEVASALLLTEVKRLIIEGHTDNVGNAAANQRLSQSRAQSVRRYLIRKGVPARSLIAQGFGDTRPIADNNTDAGRAKNRRVDFVIEATKDEGEGNE